MDAAADGTATAGCWPRQPAACMWVAHSCN